MKKSMRAAINAKLNKALEPPRPPKPIDNSADIINRYAPAPALPRTDSVPRSESVPDTESTPDPVQNISGLVSEPHTESVPRKGYLRLPNEFVYDIMPRLKPSDGYVLLYLIARTHGFRRGSGTFTLDSIAKACSISRSQARVNVNSLVKRGLVRHLGTDNTNRDPLLRGLVLEVIQPLAAGTESVRGIESARGTESTPIKEHTLKDTHNTDGVRAGSRFTLQECRRYAESLRSEGINNPGGYSTKIHRSGEADELIAAFLAPVEAESVDTSKCEDCAGTGFRQETRDGVSKMVRCRHERLAAK